MQSVQEKYKPVSVSLIEQFKNAKSSIESNKKQPLEVELKIQNLGASEFFRIMDYLKNKIQEVTITNSTDYVISKVRYSKIDNGSKITKTTKELIKNFDDFNWNTRLSVNIEKSVGGIMGDFKLKDIDFINAELIRKKKRYTFNFKNYRIDMTYVVETKNKKTSYSYECEIEFINYDQKTIEDASKLLAEIFNVRQNSENVYTEQEKFDIIDKLNLQFGKSVDKKHGLDHTFMGPARNLKYADIVDGGIIGSYTSKKNEFGKTFKTNIDEKEKGELISYTVTIKADGTRKQFLIFNEGIWLVYPPYDFNLLGRSNSIKQYHGLMIDGEDISIDKRKPICPIKTKYMYIAFDMCLAPNEKGGNIKIQEESQLKRLELANKYLNSLKSLQKIGITFDTKDFLLIENSFESLSGNVTKLIEKMKTVDYETDGLIFTPNNTYYNTLTDTLKIKDRVLTHYPDICKLKPWSHQTIDFLVNNEEQLLMGRGYGQNIVAFEGSFYPFNQKTQVNWNHPLFETIVSGVIVEFEPKKVKLGDQTLIILSPKQIRNNKTLPNRTDYAAMIWDDINNPLEFETLQGKTFKLLRHNFNKIKKSLYSDIPEDSHIFEIGTGNGGQMSRWLNLGKILGVEPDPIHIEEMNKRLTSFDKKLSEKVHVIQGGGEESDRIVEEAKKWFGWNEKKKNKKSQDYESLPPFYIVSMLSLSFFWKDITMLNGLISTIQKLTEAYKKAGGENDVYFIFMTIEGHSIIDLFNTYPDLKIKNSKIDLDLGQCQMQLNLREKFPSLEINIDDTIVSSQTEYLVNFNDLNKTIPLEKYKLNPILIEKCMSENEKNYAKLFVTGKIKIGNISNSSILNKMSDTTKSNKIQRQQEEEEKIFFRISGRVDFLTRRFWNETRYHQDNSELLGESKNDDLKSYFQYPFGFSNDNNEWYSLGNIPDNKFNIYSSLLNCILISTYKDYQETETEFNKLRMIDSFMKQMTSQLKNKTNFPSNTAKKLNPLIKGWLNEDQLYNLAMEIAIERKLAPNKFKRHKISENNFTSFTILLSYYKGENIREFGSDNKFVPEEEEEIVEIYQDEDEEEDSDEEDIIKKPLAYIIGKMVDNDWIEDEEEDFPTKIYKIHRYFKWKGEFESITDFVDSFSNEDYLQHIFKKYSINENSIFYNCAAGLLFRYYFLTDPLISNNISDYNFKTENAHFFQFSFIFDILNITMKTMAMPDEDDNKVNITYKDDEEDDIVLQISNRNFCMHKTKFSFTPTSLQDDETQVDKFYKLWQREKRFKSINFDDIDNYVNSNKIGKLTWGKKDNIQKTTPTIYSYYHYIDIDTGSRGKWVQEDNSLNGIFIPLAQLKGNLMKTLF